MHSPINFNRKITIILFLAIPVIFISFAVFNAAINKKTGKVLLIGLDGASWKIIMPLVNQGKLPNIKHLLEGGCSGKLETLRNPLSELVWTTIATGKPPELHGIVDQLMADPDTGEFIPVTGNFRKVKALWNILSAYNKKVGMVGYRVSWPAEKVNGFIITDRFNSESYSSLLYAQPPLSSFCTAKMFRDFNNNSLNHRSGDNIDYGDFLANIAEYLYKNNRFDFFCLYLDGIDSRSHQYWQYMFPNNHDLSPEEISKYKDIIPNYYIWCDSVIGRLLRIADKETTVIIISDHGFKTRDQQERLYIFAKVDALLTAAGLKKINYNSKEVKLKNLNFSGDRKDIGIYGKISKEDLDIIRENAKNILSNIKVKEDGNSLFHMHDDTQSGFIFEMDRQYNTEPWRYHILIAEKEYNLLDFLKKSPESGTHDEDDAIIIISGKDIRTHIKLNYYASVYDIAPTALYLLNMPVANDMRGKVLTGAINPKLLKREHVRYIDTYEDNKSIGTLKPVRSPAEESIIKERMRSLGYLND